MSFIAQHQSYLCLFQDGRVGPQRLVGYNQDWIHNTASLAGGKLLDVFGSLFFGPLVIAYREVDIFLKLN